MPIISPDMRIIRDVDFELLFNKTKNPIYCWLIIWINTQQNKPIPKFVLEYLKEISRNILEADSECETKNIGNFLFKQLGFSSRKQLQAIDKWSKFSKINRKINSYMATHKVSQNKALDALKITTQGSLDTHLIRAKAIEEKELDERKNIYAETDKKRFENLPIELQCAQKTHLMTIGYHTEEPYGKKMQMCFQCPERFGDCRLTLENRLLKLWDY